jgi:hypothetical protein
MVGLATMLFVLWLRATALHLQVYTRNVCEACRVNDLSFDALLERAEVEGGYAEGACQEARKYHQRHKACAHATL